jgi:hypothetical protein
MDIVRVENSDEMRAILDWVFFRKDGEPTEYGEPEFEFSELCSLLGVSENDMVDQSLVPHTDPWYNATDNLDGESVREHAIVNGNAPLISGFKKGILVWHLEDSFDRLSGCQIRMFLYQTDEDSTFINWSESLSEL